jgi:retron-type reverse transcriptase
VGFEHNLGENLLRLQTELVEQSYQPGPYRHFVVIERKERKISAAPYRDRVVHHALMNIIQPIFEARFIYHSYACRKDKGTHRALNQAQAQARRYPYALQGDIREFFPEERFRFWSRSRSAGRAGQKHRRPGRASRPVATVRPGLSQFKLRKKIR